MVSDTAPTAATPIHPTQAVATAPQTSVALQVVVVTPAHYPVTAAGMAAFSMALVTQMAAVVEVVVAVAAETKTETEAFYQTNFPA